MRCSLIALLIFAAKIVPAGLESTGRRAALAGWLTDPENRCPHGDGEPDLALPFGRGIVGSPSDFGVMGRPPIPNCSIGSPPSLSAAVEMKRMHR